MKLTKVRTHMPSVAIVYLDRWGNPPRFAQTFLDSLLSFPAGAEFDIIWQMKGYPEGANSTVLNAFKPRFQGKIYEQHYSDNLYQFSLALDAAQTFEYDYFLFFISWSRIIGPNWLKFYFDVFATYPDCGIVGASASYERLLPDQAFPNPHIRTNAYMVARKLYLSLYFGILDNKAAGRFVEAGPNSITAQIRKVGLRPMLIDRDGTVFQIEDWPKSRTFRLGEQEGLLVADNQTDHFMSLSKPRRKHIVGEAWGNEAPLNKNGLLKRYYNQLRYLCPK